jgi:hypothetical protein
LSNVTAEEFKLQSPENALGLFKGLVANCLDQEIEDRECIVPKVFAKLYDTTVFQENHAKWRSLSFFRKDCPSAFLLFVLLKEAELSKHFPHASRHDLGLLLAEAFVSDESLRKIYQWNTYPETRKSLWRTSHQSREHIERADKAQPNIGKEEVDWDEIAVRLKIKVEQCMYCGLQVRKVPICRFSYFPSGSEVESLRQVQDQVVLQPGLPEPRLED